MVRQIDTLSHMGLLSRLVGMLTASRSFLSYPRHEYFRQVLCNLLGADVENGELPGIDQQAVQTVYLRGSFALLRRRIEARQGHYMDPDLLQCQRDTLKVPSGGITMDIAPTPAVIVESILNQITDRGGSQ